MLLYHSLIVKELESPSLTHYERKKLESILTTIQFKVIINTVSQMVLFMKWMNFSQKQFLLFSHLSQIGSLLLRI